MAKVNFSIRYECRKALEVAQRVADALGASPTLGISARGYLLSVKESNSWESADGEEAKTSFTFRFEGGFVVRVPMYGMADSSYGFQWSPGLMEVKVPSPEYGEEKFTLRLYSSRIETQIRAIARRGGFAASQRLGRRNVRLIAENRRKCSPRLLERVMRCFRETGVVPQDHHFVPADEWLAGWDADPEVRQAAIAAESARDNEVAPAWEYRVGGIVVSAEPLRKYPHLESQVKYGHPGFRLP